MYIYIHEYSSHIFPPGDSLSLPFAVIVRVLRKSVRPGERGNVHPGGRGSNVHPRGRGSAPLPTGVGTSALALPLMAIRKWGRRGEEEGGKRRTGGRGRTRSGSVVGVAAAAGDKEVSAPNWGGGVGGGDN